MVKRSGGKCITHVGLLTYGRNLFIRESPSIGIKYGVEACDHWLGFFLCFPFYYHSYAIVGKKGVEYCFGAKRMEG
jgi:hypothetical protein